MDSQNNLFPLWECLGNIVNSLRYKRLAEVFRFVSFYSHEKFGPHSHDRIEINYVKKGNCLLRCDNEIVTFKEGEMMVITPNVSHTFESGNNGTVLLQLEFLPDIFYRFGGIPNLVDSSSGNDPVSVFSKGNKVIKIVNNDSVMQAVQRIVNELEYKNQFFQPLVVMYYAELLILIYRYVNEVYESIGENPTLTKAITFIHDHFHEDISISDVAGHTGVSSRYLRSLFSKYLGMSPLEYLNQRRINKAVELFRDSDLSVKEVCYRCGFKSPQYFSTAFRKQTGISPRDMAR